MKKGLFISLILIISASLFAQEILSFGFSSGVINGNIHEYVFDKTRTKTNNHMSQLDWDVVNIPYVELYGSLSPDKYFYINTNLKFGFPKESGFMQDYDWLNGTSSGLVSWKNDDIGELTNYSIHTNQLKNYIDCSISIGGNIYLPKEIIISPFVNYNTTNIYFDGNDGYGVYKTRNWEKYSYSGNVISYNLISKGIFLGVNVKANTIEKLDIEVCAAVSPYLYWTDAYDIHVLRNITFHDEIYKVLAAKANLSVLYNINKHNKVGLEGAVKYHPESYGTVQKVSSGMGGLSYFLYDVSLKYRFSL